MRRFYGSAGLVAVALLTVALALAPEESLDLAVLTQIRDEGYNRSQVMETAGYLCDVIGPRLTGSPAYKKAHEWTRERLEKWGLKNSRLES